MTDDTFDESVKCVDSLTTEAFDQHVLTERRPWTWKAARVDRWTYGFYLLVSPGAVLVYGDVGEAIFRMYARSEEEVMDWLKGCVKDRYYTMVSKLANRDAFRRFYPGDALAYAKSVSEEFYQELQELDADSLLIEHKFYEAALDRQLYDIPSCVNWSPSALWMVAVLKCFVRLHEN